MVGLPVSLATSNVAPRGHDDRELQQPHLAIRLGGAVTGSLHVPHRARACVPAGQGRRSRLL